MRRDIDLWQLNQIKRPRDEDIDGINDIPDDPESEPPKSKHFKHDHHCSPPPPATGPSPQSEPVPKKTKRGIDGPSSPAKRRRVSEDDPLWYRNKWLKLKRDDIDVPTTGGIEAGTSVFDAPESEDAFTDSMSLRDGDCQQPGSSVAGSDRSSISNPRYRGVQKLHNIVHDDDGEEIPQDVQHLIDKHILKTREGSPPLDKDVEKQMRQSIREARGTAEPTVISTLAPHLFSPLKVPGLQMGADLLWSRQPMPFNADVQIPLALPKTDLHFGFRTILQSDWDVQKQTVTEDSLVRPYAQPTRETLFSSYLCEFKSEASGGTLYGAENQLATAGAHRVNSVLHLLDLAEPGRTRSSTDALVFSLAISARQAVAYVHFFRDRKFYMSFIDNFYFGRDVPRFHSYIKNMRDWLVSVQQPQVKDLLTRLIPVIKGMKRSKRGRPTPASDVSQTIGNDQA